jgi:hypothetical protein
MANAAAGAQSIQAGETLTATVVAGPTVDTNAVALTTSTLLNAAVAFSNVTPASSDNGTTYSSHTTTASWNTVSSGTCAAGVFTSACTAVNDNAKTSTTDISSYFLRVLPGNNFTIGSGTYTIRLRLTNNAGALLVQDTLVKVTFVNGAVNSGALISVATSGSFPAATAQATYSSTRYAKATVTDANGGQLVSETTAGTTTAPAVTVDLLDKDSTLITGATGLAAVDDATTADNAYTSTAATDYTLTNTNVSKAINGVYGITADANSFPVAQIGATNLIRARYGASSGTAAVTIINTATIGTTGAFSVKATGLPVTNVSPDWTLPLSTTAATVKVSGQTPGAAVVFTVTWATTATGSVSPKSGTPQVVYADSTGAATLDLTNSAPTDGASASITVAGLANNPATQTITWKKSTATIITVDIDGAYVALLSANKATATVLDSFGAPVAGVQLVPSIVTGSSNASSTRTYAAVTTDAAGQASYSWTDALAVAAGTDTVKFTVLGGTVNGSGTITYAATAPVATALTGFYNADPTTTSSYTAVVTAVPTTGIYVDGVSSKFPVKINRNNSKPITVAASQDSLKIRVRAGVAGVKVTATGTSGVWFLGTSNLAVSTTSAYADQWGDVYFVAGSTKAGANTVTFTSGTVTSTAAFWSDSAAANARFVTLTGSKTGVANGDLNSYVVTVTDRYGNPMGSQTVSISASGAAVLGGGGTVASYTTDSTGTFQFTGTSLNAAGGTGTFKVSVPTTTEFASIAGYSGTSSIDSSVAAANNSATIAVEFTAGDSAAAANAQAAADAAAEATDAANAATDAANAAAEAADAATAAAQDAADAVAALSAQVADLISGLKAQLTALTNLVIKIQKKVKA